MKESLVSIWKWILNQLVYQFYSYMIPELHRTVMHNICIVSLLLATKYGRTRSNLVKQSKMSSILLEPCFDFGQRKSWTSGMFNYGSNKLNVEPSVSATHQLGENISKDNLWVSINLWRGLSQWIISSNILPNFCVIEC